VSTPARWSFAPAAATEQPWSVRAEGVASRARLVALTHKLDGLVRSDAVKNYSEFPGLVMFRQRAFRKS